MKNYKNLFHYISFLQYPFLLIGLYYSYKHTFYENTQIWADINYSLLFIGIGISFASFADLSRKSKIEKKLMKNKKFVKAFLIYLIILILIIIGVGVYSLFFTNIKPLQELAVGIIVFGIGVIGLLKTFIDSVEINKKNTTFNTL